MGSKENLIRKLVDACHILTDEGQGDLVWGHVSVRSSDRPDRVFIKPAGLGMEEITAEHIITADLDGNRVAGDYPMHVEVYIHTEILRSRPEVASVVHTHPPHAVAFSSLQRPLEPVGHEGALFCEGLPVFDETSDLIVTAALGASLARKVGGHHAALLRNHGIVTAGASIEEAVMTAIMLEKACKVQLLAEAAGGPRAVSTPEDALAKRKRLYRPATLVQAYDYCLRRHHRLQPTCCCK